MSAPTPALNPDASAAGSFAAALTDAITLNPAADGRASAVRRLLADHPPQVDVAGLDCTEPRTAELTLARILSRIPLAAAGPLAGRLVRAILFLPLSPGERLHAVRLILADLDTLPEGRTR
ncbi:MAG: hypothetical protein IT450_20635 [Phycisphaerales bacterium]|nr:hypothetical protein [Phycisphaerales bacterium]